MAKKNKKVAATNGEAEDDDDDEDDSDFDAAALDAELGTFVLQNGGHCRI